MMDYVPPGRVKEQVAELARLAPYTLGTWHRLLMVYGPVQSLVEYRHVLTEQGCIPEGDTGFAFYAGMLRMYHEADCLMMFDLATRTIP